MNLLYFAWVREGIGQDQETCTPPQTVRTVRDLIGWLRTRGDGYAETLKDETRLRVAVNQDLATLDTELSGEDEVAIFPPVTGG